MSALGDGVTWVDWARMVAAEHGVHGLTDRELDGLLWEHTAYPVSGDPSYLRPQLVAALVGPPLCPCCGGGMVDDQCGICGPCAAAHGWAAPHYPLGWW